MKELHKSSYNDVTSFENSEGQRGLLCSNKTSLSRCPSLGSNQGLSKDTLEALEELGAVLESIHVRMRADGFVFKNGVLIKLQDVNAYE